MMKMIWHPLSSYCDAARSVTEGASRLFRVFLVAPVAET